MTKPLIFGLVCPKDIVTEALELFKEMRFSPDNPSKQVFFLIMLSLYQLTSKQMSVESEM